MTFESRIAGIPCQIDVTYYYGGCSARTWGDPSDCYPAEDEEFEFTVLDRRGRKAAWLERKLTDADHDRLLQEYKDHCNDY